MFKFLQAIIIINSISFILISKQRAMWQYTYQYID